MADDPLASLLDAFDDDWSAGRRPDWAEYLARAADPDRPELLRELVQLELDHRLRRGEPARVEEYLSAHPALATDPDAVARLASAEYRVRAACGEPVTPAEYLARFPAHRDALAERLGGPPELPGLDVGEELGRGGMGVVYRATDTEFDRPVAVKLVLPRFAGAADVADRVRAEARITGRLQHPGIPPVHSLGTLPDGRPFLVMKLIRGRTLADLLAEPAAGRPQLLLQVFEQVCQAVGYAHAQGVIHRDLKPQNIMVGAFGEVQVMDWGLAKLLPSGAALAARADADGNDTISGPVDATQGGFSMGTPAYMPPEQANGEPLRVGPWSDVFALGAVLCEILTGRPPYSDGDADARLADASAARLDTVFDRLAGCGADAELVALARRCLSPLPADRPPDASAAAFALSEHRLGVERRLRAAEHERTAAEARAAEEGKRRRAQRRLAGAVLLLLSVGGAFAWYADRQSAARAAERATRTGATRAAVDVSLDQAEQSLRADKPDEARIALDAAAERLAADAPDEPRAARLAHLRQQWDCLVALDRIHDGRRTLADGRVDRPSAVRDYPAVFRRHGFDPADPAGVAERLAGWAVREQVLGGLDTWLKTSPRQPGLRELLAVLDPSDTRNGWRSAVGGSLEDRRRAADRLVGQDHPPRFVAAYGTSFPRPVGLRLLRAAVAGHPNSVPLAFATGFVLERGDDRDRAEAVGFYRACLGLRPGHTAALNNLGVVLADQGRWDEAMAYYRRALAHDPGYTHSLCNLGNALKGRGQVDAAMECYRAALAVDPEHVNSLLGLGGAFDRKGQAAEAAEYYRKCLAADPENANAHHNLGMQHKEANDWDRAIEQFARAVALDPAHTESHFQLGYALTGQKRSAEAVEHYRAVVQHRPKYASAHYNLANLLRVDRRLAEAAEHYRQTIALAPTHAEAHCNLGNCLCGQGRYAEAVEWYRKGHELLEQQKNTRNKSADWVQKAERLRDLDSRSARLATGTVELSMSEYLKFAELCDWCRRYTDAARLSAQAARMDGSGGDARNGVRYLAAVYAILAASGTGIDPPAAGARPALRSQALDRLRAELAAWQGVLRTGPDADRTAATRELRRWSSDVRLASVRDYEPLADLPEAERFAWGRFWTDVQDTLAGG